MLTVEQSQESLREFRDKEHREHYDEHVRGAIGDRRLLDQLPEALRVEVVPLLVGGTQLCHQREREPQ